MEGAFCPAAGGALLMGYLQLSKRKGWHQPGLHLDVVSWGLCGSWGGRGQWTGTSMKKVQRKSSRWGGGSGGLHAPETGSESCLLLMSLLLFLFFFFL